MDDPTQDFKTVTELINASHLSTNSTIGAPTHIPIHGLPLVPSINLSAAYEFSSIDSLSQYYSAKTASVRYGRDSSQLVLQLETYISAMHGGYPCCLFQSGMAAINACIQVASKGRSTILTIGACYRKTLGLIEKKSAEIGASHIHLENFEEIHLLTLQKQDPLILIESPSNPFLKIVDIRRLKEIFPDSFLILDATLQGLLNDKVGLYNFADLTVASCTKYIGGHNDLLAGYVVASLPGIYQDIWETRSSCGGIIDNLSAYLLLRSLRTYDIRIATQLRNTELVLDFLSTNPLVEHIYYPGRFDNSHENEVFSDLYYHGGSLVTFKVSDAVSLEASIGTLLSTKMAPSFGSVDTLIEIPAYMSHWGKSKKELQTLGLDHRTVRLSVGLEPSDYIIKDLYRLLRHDSC